VNGQRHILNLLTGVALVLIVAGCWEPNPHLGMIMAGTFFFVFFAFGPLRRERPLPR
jgi:hypothetical protein